MSAIATARAKFAALLAATAAAAMFVAASPASAAFSIESFDGGVFKPNGDPATQAGSHPWTASTRFVISSVGAPVYSLTEQYKDIVAHLPAGFVGNPSAVPTCSIVDLMGPNRIGVPTCSVDSQIGYTVLKSAEGNSDNYLRVYNLQPNQGSAALFGFNFSGTLILLEGRVRTGGDYGVDVVTRNISQTLQLNDIALTVWGVPSSPALDAVRGPCTSGFTQLPTGALCPSSLGADPKPFLTLPTSCVGPVETQLDITGWEGTFHSASFLSHDNSLPTPNPIGNDGCNALDFSPSIEARPTTNVADSPSGLDVTLHVPQNDDPDDVAEAHLRDTVVTLPEGLTVNPSSANGLDACAPAQIDLSGEGAANCPDASKLGTVSVETPLLDHPVEGAVYIARPHNNPFDSLLALYIALDDVESGVVVKLAGEVQPDPVTGQLKATFADNPQLPFEEFKLHFFGGAGGSLRTPATCGTYETKALLTPWSAPDSGPPAAPSDVWAIEQGQGGGCASEPSQLPNSPSFDAGTMDPIAAAKTPLVVNLRRDDGTQQFHSVTLSPPQGLVGKLAGIPYCSQSALDEAAAKSGRAEEASPSCPQASYVGSVTAAAGAGPAPYYAPGKAYLTGPYKGAPLSIAIVTPATAGPFDLGTIVVKTALYVDRTTAQITAVSDPIPSILQGIPLDVRSVQVKMDRPDFTINPTSCDPSSFGGQLMSTLGQTAPLQSRFQVGECGRLAFKPQLTLALKGGTKRTGHPALTATMTMPEGGANLAAISVALPHSEFLDQSHIGTICTRVQFKADQCPAASIYGTVQVDTPLLDYPLTGNVYLRSSDNPLPDLVPDLRGPAFQPIALEADGRVDSVKGGIRNTFDFVPDAPFSKLTLSMQGGKKGLLENSTNLCRKVQRATVNYTAHNGATLTARPALKVKCGKKKGKRRGHGGHRAR